MEEKVYDGLLRSLDALGGKAANAVLMRRMGVEPDLYIAIKEAALADKVIKLGRGRGGMVLRA